MQAHAVKARLKYAIFLTSGILCLELAGGIVANSLALLGDAAHLFMDIVALGLTLGALVICEQPATHTRTFGYHRLETFASFLNGALLTLLALALLYESVTRLLAPEPVQSVVMTVVASVGLAANLVVVYYLREPAGHTHDLNLKSAFYHVVGDSLASLGVIVGGIVMYFTAWTGVDSLLGIAIASLILWGGTGIVRESLHILLEGVPKGVSLAEVERALTALPAIRGIHELHVWCICSNIYALSTHALLREPGSNSIEPLLREIKLLLKERFNITHSTIQFENIPCDNNNIICDIKH